MGFFDKLLDKLGLQRKQNTTPPAPVYTKPPAPTTAHTSSNAVNTSKPSPVMHSHTRTSGINLSKEQSISKIDLHKHELGIILEKSGLNAHRARVALVLDYSGSMMTMYKNGTVQRIIERVLPLGLRFDDDQQIDLFLFSDGDKHADIGTLHKGNFYEYVNDVILTKWKHLKGATEYAPVIRMITKKYVSTPGDPAYVLFVTDGDNTDKRAAKDAIKDAAHHGIFWQFLGIGHEQFAFLERLDTMTGRIVDNANFFQVNDIDTVPDKELYERMMGEFPEWIKKAQQLKIIQ